MVDRLKEDHATAKRLAAGLHRIDARLENPQDVETNLVRVDVSANGRSAAQWSDDLKGKGVRVSPASISTLRFVTHRHIGNVNVDAAVSAVASLWKNS
jgi:threonine aldolase